MIPQRPPLVLVLSPPWRTVFVLENVPTTHHPPPTPRAFLRGFAASREANCPAAAISRHFNHKTTDLGLETPSYKRPPPADSHPQLAHNSPLAPVKRGRGDGGEGATLPT
ncbi:MAG: hypothetical protein ACKPJD_04740, partial [Planctomycetaceae bacterium]